MERIVIIGTTGSGKSTLAETLTQRMQIEFIELDALFWEANWTQVSTELFRERVAQAILPERWVAGGNYSKARDLIWTRADTLIWLDYPLALVISRLLRRTVRRVVMQEELWGGNHETWQKQFFSRDSLFVWAVKTHGKYRQSMEQTLSQPAYAHLKLLHFTSPRQTSEWLKTI